MQKAVRTLLVAVGVVASLQAQTSRGSLSGLVTDPAGSAVPGAKIELTGVNTNVVRTGNANSAGLYRFDAVDLGDYFVAVSAPGFKVTRSQALSITANQTATFDVQLEVGEQKSIVEVSAQAALLQTEAPVRGGNIATINITELPFNTRNPASLALTVPGVGTQRFAPGGVGSFSVNGSRGRSNNFLIDGTENNDISVAGQAFQITNPDAVQEVSVQTSNFDSEFGRAAGAVVNVITKSGANAYHGTVSYLLDVTNDDAITSQQSLDPNVTKRGSPLPGTEQIFAGTFGGRIIRDRTFFFGSYQEDRQNASGSTTAIVPSAAGYATLNSLFPNGSNKNLEIYKAATAGLTATSQFSPIALGLGRPAVEFGTAAIGFPQKFTDRQFTIRIDHQISQKDQLSGRFLYDDQSNPAASISFSGFNTSQKNRFQNALISETHVFSPTFTNEFRLPYNRITLSFPVDSTNSLGNTLPNYLIAGLNTGGVTTLGVATNLPQGRIANNYDLQDTLTKIAGSHTMRFGVELLDQRSRQFAPIVQRGALTYNASTGFTGFANFLDDFAGSGSNAAQRDFGNPSYYPGLFRQAYFFQDRWRVNQSLTVSLGVRYEYFGVPVNSVKTPAYAGIFNLDPVTLTGPYSAPNKVNKDLNNFGPSVGIAYAPAFSSGPLGWVFGDHKAVIRTGYQIGYDSFFNNIASNAATSSPNIVSTLVPSTVSAALPRGLANLSTLLPTVARPLSALDAQTLVVKNLVNPYYQKWSFGIQRELKGNVLLDVSYVGSKGTKLFINEDLNPLVPKDLQISPAVIPAGYKVQGRLDNLQGARTIRTNGGSSYYHSLQTQATRRFSNGLFATGAYTWSKAIDYGSEVFAANNTPSVAAVPTIFGGLPREKAVSLFDRTHRGVFTYGWQVPVFKSQKSLIGHVLGGWEISGVTTYESGVPFTILNGQDADGFGGNNDRPDFNPRGQKNVRAIPNPAGAGYVNPDAGNAPIDPATAMYIGLPTGSGRTGNLGRNTFRTDGLHNWNANLLKSVQITERFRAEFRTEFYNVFNTPQFGVLSVSPFAANSPTQLSGSVFSSASGRFLNNATVDGGGRVIRYQLKLAF